MRNKYKKKSSVEQVKKENQIINQITHDTSNFNYSKILSPDIKTKNKLILNGSIDKKETIKDKLNIDVNNQYNHNTNKINKYIKINNIYQINNKNNSILTASYEFKNRKTNKNINNIKYNFSNKYFKRLNKDNKENKLINENIKNNKGKDNLKNIIENINFLKNSPIRTINDNEIKNSISNCLNQKRVYHPLINKFFKEKKDNNPKIENNNIKTNINESKDIIKSGILNNNRYNNSQDNKINDKENKIINKDINKKGTDTQNDIKKVNEKNSSCSVDTKNINQPNNSLKFLIHQANKIQELAESFNKIYIPSQTKINYKKRTYDPKVDKYSNNKTIFFKLNNKMNKNKEKKDNTQYNENKENKENKTEAPEEINSLNINDTKVETFIEKDEKTPDKKYIKNIIKNNINIKVNKCIINLSNIKDNNKNKKCQRNNSSDEILQKKVSNEENTINENKEDLKTYCINSLELKNNTKLNANHGISLSENKYTDNKGKKNWSFLNIIPNSYLLKNNNKNNINNNNKYSFTSMDSTINNNNKYENIQIDFEGFYTLEMKFKKILKKVNNYQKCENECFDWITYFFNTNFFYKELNIFISQNNKYSMSKFIKMEILCIFLCYNAFFHKNFSQINSYLISLINFLYNNYIILLIFITNNYNFNNNKNNNLTDNNNILINKIRKLIVNEEIFKLYQYQIKNEVDVLFFINNNFKDINNYYQYIFSNLYTSAYNSILNDKNFLNNIKYSENNIIPFTYFAKVDKSRLNNNQIIGLLSLFFYDYYKMPDNYNIEDLFFIFENFLLESDYNNNNIINFINNDKNQLKYRDFSSINNNSPNQYFLPPIKKCYKYTLVLDLDETLVYCRKEKNLNYNNSFINKTLIMRPGLLEFLHKMKQIYELVLFSLGTCDYVNNIVNIIEKKEKFFEYILYRQHATYNDNIYIKNLSLLGRDLKNIIIVDDIPEVFKLHKNNGICIKPFYGDVVEERNTLKFLGNILQKIRFDAEESGDIRESLKQHRDLIYNHITTNIESN